MLAELMNLPSDVSSVEEAKASSAALRVRATEGIEKIRMLLARERSG